MGVYVCRNIILILITLGILFVHTRRFSLTERNSLDTYVYPVKPETKEWKELKTLEEKVASVQIPEDVVKTISDEGLIETILQFPLLNLDAYNSEEIAYWHLYNQCNGVSELLTSSMQGQP